MKICSVCRINKNETDFSTNGPKYLRSDCKKCHSLKVTNRNKDPKQKEKKKLYQKSKKYKEMKKRYLLSEKGKETTRAYSKKRYHSLERVREFNKSYGKIWKKTEKGKECGRRYREKAIEIGRYRVYHKVLTALRNGSLVKEPCKICGSIKAHAHHHDYSKPLDVVWLCPKHHAEEHRRIEK